MSQNSFQRYFLDHDRLEPTMHFKEMDLDTLEAKKESSGRTKIYNSLTNQIQNQEKRLEKSPNKAGFAEEFQRFAELKEQISAASAFNTQLYKTSADPSEFHAAYFDFLKICTGGSLSIAVKEKVWQSMCEQKMTYRDYHGFADLCNFKSSAATCFNWNNSVLDDCPFGLHCFV